MARRTLQGNVFQDLTATMGSAAARQAEGENFLSLMGSSRPDMAGTSGMLLQNPITYQERVSRMWEAYNTDPLFHRLIERVCDFVANGSEWEIPIKSEGSWLRKLDRWGEGREERIKREEEFWNTWSQDINEDVPDMLPGLDQIIRWAVKHFLLSGMFVPHWEYDWVTYGKQQLMMPVRMTCYNGAVVTLRRDNKSFMQEDIYVMQGMGKTVQEGVILQAPQYVAGRPSNMIPLPQLQVRSTVSRPGMDEATAVKYAWTPGDLSTVKFGGRAVTGLAVYPTPPFYGLLPQFVIRQKLFASDAAILDGVLNYLLLWQLGDEKHPPTAPILDKNGTVVEAGMIAQFAAAIRSQQRAGPAVELFVPYWAKLNIIMPDGALLLNEEKYYNSAIEIMAAFGFLMSRSPGGRNERFDKINISSFEEFLGGIRQHVASFLRMLAKRIVNANKGKLTVPPVWSPAPVNTKSEQFLKAIKDLVDYGQVSSETLLRYHGLDNGVELRRIASEIAQDVDDLHEANVPVSYKQQAVQPDRGGENRDMPGSEPDQGAPAPSGEGPVTKPGRRPMTKTTGIPRSKQKGRPPE